MTTFRRAATWMCCSALTAFCGRAGASDVPGRVDNMRLEASTSVYSYSNGAVLRDGIALGAVNSGEAERAIRLALLSLWLERDPLFFTPAPPPGLAEAVTRLRRLDRDLLTPFTPGEKLYPMDFLGAYAAASAAYAKFADAPSESGATGLLDGIGAAINAYSAEAVSISSSVAGRFEAAKIDRLAGLGGGNYFDRRTVIADFELIKRNAAAALERLAGLRACLADSASCRPAWPAALSAEAPSPESSRPRLRELADLDLEGKTIGGPYLVETSCWKGRRENYFYYSERCEPDGMCLDWSYLATDVLFRKIDSDSPTHKKMREAGLKVESVSATTLYACPDKGYLAVIKALDSFTKKYQGRSAFAGLGPAGLPAAAAPRLAAARAAEAAYFAERFKSQRSLDRLAGAYQTLLSALDGTDLQLRTELRDRLRLMTARTEHLPLLFNRIVFHVSMYKDRALLAYRPGPPADPVAHTAGLFMSRNFYSLMFLTFSPTVWRLAERPVFVSGHLPDAELRYFGLDEAIRLYGRDEVRKAVRGSAVKREEIVRDHQQEREKGREKKGAGR